MAGRAQGAPKPLRADSARNAEKIVRTARAVYAEHGPDAPLDEIARRAGVGIATLYRWFPDKTALIRAVLEHAFEDAISPAIERALGADDPRQGLRQVIEAAVSLAAREYNTVAAAKNAGAVTTEVGDRIIEPMALLVRRGQEAGVIRADLVGDDIRRILVMCVSVLWTLDPREEGWRRYVVLMLDALSPDGASPLPPAAALRLRHRAW